MELNKKQVMRILIFAGSVCQLYAAESSDIDHYTSRDHKVWEENYFIGQAVKEGPFASLKFFDRNRKTVGVSPLVVCDPIAVASGMYLDGHWSDARDLFMRILNEKARCSHEQHVLAIANIAYMYSKGLADFERDPNKAIDMYEEALELSKGQVGDRWQAIRLLKNEIEKELEQSGVSSQAPAVHAYREPVIRILIPGFRVLVSELKPQSRKHLRPSVQAQCDENGPATGGKRQRTGRC